MRSGSERTLNHCSMAESSSLKFYSGRKETDGTRSVSRRLRFCGRNKKRTNLVQRGGGHVLQGGLIVLEILEPLIDSFACVCGCVRVSGSGLSRRSTREQGSLTFGTVLVGTLSGGEPFRHGALFKHFRHRTLLLGPMAAGRTTKAQACGGGHTPGVEGGPRVGLLSDGGLRSGAGGARVLVVCFVAVAVAG